MTNTRTIKELLTVMLENEHLFERGLCSWVYNCYKNLLINGLEWDKLHFYIKDNSPFTIHRVITLDYTGYYWRIGNIKPRIRWIKRHIKKNS